MSFIYPNKVSNGKQVNEALAKARDNRTENSAGLKLRKWKVQPCFGGEEVALVAVKLPV